MQNSIDILRNLFHQWTGNDPGIVTALPRSGSERRYFRLSGDDKSAIGAWNPVIEENEAFIHFTQHFHSHGLHVPEIYGVGPGNEVYLEQDLGNTSLYSLVEANAREVFFPADLRELYKYSLKELVRFQVVAGKDLDYRLCYPHASFDQRSMKWDLNYFKYYFLKLHVSFHEGRLEDDFDSLIHFLGQAESNYFMYRDFQSRNILIKDSQPYFIDYQGGRKGPLQYDVASLLFQVKADLPFELREELLDYYISELSSHISFDKEIFKKHYSGFVLMRLLQVLGAYGFRGLIEKKPHFLASIPFALKNLNWWLDHADPGIELPELKPALAALTRLDQYRLENIAPPGDKLMVRIKSFSYREGVPADSSGNGGGFVFDCRALPNPGREERYRAYNGRDQVIIDYLKNDPDVISFINDAEKMVGRSIDNYLSRGFKSLSVNFGCTGGQHRSVYCAETLAERLRNRYPDVYCTVKHTMLEIDQ